MKLFLTGILIGYSTCIFGQKSDLAPLLTKTAFANDKASSTKKTKAEKDNEEKEPQYFYLTLSTNLYVNTVGGFSQRFSPAIEFGRTYGIFDIGLASGRLNTLAKGRDTTFYMELRPTINVFSKGRFSESLCLGMGAVFKADQSLMTEIANSINFNISENVAIAVEQSYVFFDGNKSNRSAQYMGFNVTYNFLRNHSIDKLRKKKALVREQ